MATEHVLELTDGNFEQEVFGSNGPILVDFWADWCQPCRIVGPTIDELAGDYAGRVKVAKLDVDANPDVAARLGISSIPTIMLFEDGRVVRKFVGVTPKHEFADALDAVAA